MGALATLAVVWLGAERPEGKAKAALDAWAAARGYSVEVPRVEPDDGGEGARTVAERCERKLEEARDHLNEGDSGAARQSLASLEQTLRDHPELLQASWLMAERYRIEAQLAARAGESAATWQERADVLEGARAPAFGESARASAELSVPVTIEVHGARAHETYWDGARTDDRFSTAQGEHHLAIVRGKRVAWSGWVSALVAAHLDVWIADAPPCSTDDLAGATFSGASDVRVPDGVRCGAWAIAGPGSQRGTIRAALCERAKCAPATTWAYDLLAPVPPAAEAGKKGFPAWATWTLAGVGAAIATSVILWQAGVFDRPEPQKKVIYDGSGL
jgi:hypothetical protein